MMNKAKKLAMLVLIFMGALWFSGCQLANEEVPKEDSEADLLCGVYLTWEDLDFPSTNDSRVYATLIIDEHNYPSFAFEGYEGIPFFVAKVYGDPGEQDDYTSTISDFHAFGCNVSLHETENEDGTRLYENSISGKVLVSEEFDQAFYYNTVYETSEGIVYMTPGNPGTMIGSTGIKVVTTSSATINDGDTVWTNSFEITVECIDPLQQAIIREMRADNQLLFSSVITEDVIPENITLKADTAYVIVEEYYLDEEGGTRITRTIMDYISEQELGYGYIVFDANGIASSEYVRMNKAD
jgi:hypothetical protein